jgi:hypothetical protein
MNDTDRKPSDLVDAERLRSGAQKLRTLASDCFDARTEADLRTIADALEVIARRSDARASV